MAVVKMKRLTVVGPSEREEWCLDTLHDLGVYHVEPFTGEVPEPGDTATKLLSLQRILRTLEHRADDLEEVPEPPDLSPEELERRAMKANARLHELESHLATLESEQLEAAPWGETTADDVAELEKRAVFPRVHALPVKDIDKIDVSDAIWHDVGDYPARGRYASVATLSVTEPVELEYDAVPPPKKSTAEYEKEIDETKKRIEKTEEELNELAGGIEKLQKLEGKLKDELSFGQAAGAAKREDGIFVLTGWCPDKSVSKVKEALTPKMALLVSDPGPNDDVPVELENPTGINFFEPLIKMFDLPKYGEWDSTVFVAPFMTLFFALALGDGVYGLLLLIAASYGRRKLDPESEFQKALAMLQLLGGVTMVMGLLTGTAMGVQLYQLGWLPDMPRVMGNRLFWTLSKNPSYFFYLSLILGIVQMTFGMAINLVKQLKKGAYQPAISTLGLMGIAPSIVAWVFLDVSWAKWAFAGSLAALVFFAYPYDGILKRLGGAFWAAYDKGIGLFGDIMSYVRIFGLGLASGIIGLVVNQMAGVAAGGAPVIGWIGAAIIFLFGHSFNFAMAVIGALVHPARLQFLEFYGTYFEGGGQPYEPLKRHESR
jgi:V/A-type H+-transporting ATPase subunit I